MINSYNKKVLEIFKNPMNMGEMKNADGVGKVGNPRCGDVMYIYIRVSKNKKGEEIIKDIKFQTLGCPAAIATSSMMTELAKGKKIEDALKITNKDVADALGKLPPIKMHCSNLAADALKKAVDNYQGKFTKDNECVRCCSGGSNS